VPFDPTPPPTSDGRGGAAPPADPEARRDQGTSPLTGPTARRVLGRALARWAPRLADLDPGRVLDRADRLDARVVVPGDAEWPTGLDDLGGSAPLCLWVRGPVDLAAAVRRSVALVGARAATAYGEHVAADLAAGLAEAGCTVVSGGAYGIDVAAHRGALAVGGPTIALLAGGVDRTYPAGNHTLLESLAREHGAVVAECPPGTAPVRARFLLRNRLIAALSGATVVVEAAWRSGALSTATHAAALLRPLGAVPGPVTSMASAGCHRLIRDGAAVCVTGTPDVLELVGPRPPTDGARQGAGPTRSLGGGAVAPGPADESTRGAVGAALGRVVDGPVVSGPVESGSVRPRPMSSGPVVPGPAVSGPVPSGPVVQGSMTSGPVRSGPAVSGSVPSAPVPEIPRPDDAEARILDALPLRGTADVDTLARTAGLARQEVEAALGRLELAGRVRRREGRWSMVRPRA
jgi:DNA processing protein